MLVTDRRVEDQSLLLGIDKAWSGLCQRAGEDERDKCFPASRRRPLLSHGLISPGTAQGAHRQAKVPKWWAWRAFAPVGVGGRCAQLPADWTSRSHESPWRVPATRRAAGRADGRRRCSTDMVTVWIPRRERRKRKEAGVATGCRLGRWSGRMERESWKTGGRPREV